MIKPLDERICAEAGGDHDEVELLFVISVAIIMRILRIHFDLMGRN